MLRENGGEIIALGKKSERWCMDVIRWLYAAHEPISCAELSLVTKLKMMQVEHALKILRYEGKADYHCERHNVRLWYLPLQQENLLDKVEQKNKV